MGLRHVFGLVELKRQGFNTFDLTALCDRHRSSAEHVASVAESMLGVRPRIHRDFHEMLEAERALDAVNIVSDTRTHEPFTLSAFNAGIHVAVEKPMALTVNACRNMIDGANTAGRVLTVSENYRRDPMNRLTKALLKSGVIGDIRLSIDMDISGGKDIRQEAAWRHFKNRGGLILEYGVHTSDLTLYFMGEVERVYAETHLWQKNRTIAPSSGVVREFYRHRVKEDIEESVDIEATAEDTGLALLRFISGAIGQITYSDAGPGEPSNAGIIYGSEGSLKLSGSRSGRPIQLIPSGTHGPVGYEDLLDEVPDFHLDDVTSRIFGGESRISEYDLSFAQADRKLIAIELQDFANAIVHGREPEVTPEVGRDAVALSYSILESGHLAKPVLFDDVRHNRINKYQQSINEP